ncbi:C40 family peptidase [Mycetocola manganoxydans]|uniref:C40 family peptidase n=1 Tax=Mycetocola manganoxydans TaxID=699879 RepID=UPI0015FFA988|nr:C40 family peptidase [Mycetocola manganoxydans]
MATRSHPDSVGDSLQPMGSDTGSNQDVAYSRRAVAGAAAASSARPSAAAKSSTWKTWRSTAIMALVVPGLFATVALPAYAFSPIEENAAGSSTLQSLKESGAQSLSVDAGVTANAVARDGYSATTEAELATARAAAEAEARRATFVSTQKTFAGPSAEDHLANPSYPSFSLDQVFAVALQYQGVPYVYGGATPAGFDCSGFVKYVYAQFGINMPHSSTAQGNMGTRISVADAVPGDLVVSAGHIGFYAGNNMILHASRPGTPLRIGPIYADNWWIVRIGI